MGPPQLPLFPSAPPPLADDTSVRDHLRAFAWKTQTTTELATEVPAGDGTVSVPTFVNEFWTSRQRAAHSLHEVSYRACFKPQLPRFFIERLTHPGDVVYDPFMGRGTTPLEAALFGRVPFGADINPLSRMLAEPRLDPPEPAAIHDRLRRVAWQAPVEPPADLLVFYHPDTLQEICALRACLLRREAAGTFDRVDAWIRMVAINRLTGHSRGFFSVYTLPPNQAVSVASQRKINADRDQVPPRRDVTGLIVGKSRQLLASCSAETHRTLAAVRARRRLVTAPAAAARTIPGGSVQLVVTSPPFLDVVNYAADNWLRCWFCGIDPAAVQLTVVKRIDDWRRAMADVFTDLARVLAPGGWIAFEVGEVRGGTVRLEEHVVPCGVAAGLTPVLVLINAQRFTKTAACWGVDNNRKGTNTNRIVLFRRAAGSPPPLDAS